MAFTPAVKILLTAMPARISVVRESPAFTASAYTNSAVHSAPKNEAAGSAPAIPGASVTTSMAKKPAPALTPITFGLAIALLRTD